MRYLTDADYKIAEENGIPRNRAYQRYYNYGYDRERAITEPLGTYRRMTPNMKLWEEWKTVAEKNGIDRQIFYNRLNSKAKKKWTAEEAASTPIGVRKNTTIDPRIYELAEQNGIGKATLRSRIFNQHWTHYRAATEPVQGGLYEDSNYII